MSTTPISENSPGSGATGSADAPDQVAVTADDFLANGGREQSPGISLYLMLVVLLLVVVGPAMAISSFTSHHISSWQVESPLTLALIGFAFIGILPALVFSSRFRLWEDVRIIYTSVVTIVFGLFGVTVYSGFIANEAPRQNVYMLLWVVGIAMLAAAAIPALVAQLREPRLDLDYLAPLPRITVPLIAILGAAHFGLGAALIGGPAFWGELIPWDVNAMDARALGVWCLGLGVGLLFALAENDLFRALGGCRAMIGVGVAQLVAYLTNLGAIDWISWSGGAALALAVGLIATGVIGIALVKRSPAQREILA